MAIPTPTPQQILEAAAVAAAQITVVVMALLASWLFETIALHKEEEQ